MPEPTENADGVCIVALPTEGDPIHGVGDVDKHVTLVWLGNTDQVTADPDDLAHEVASVAARTDPLAVRVASTGKLGDDGANVAFLNSDDLDPVRNDLLAQTVIKDQHDAVKQYPNFTAHTTTSYDGEPPELQALPEEINIDRLSLWNGDDKRDFPLGGNVAVVAAASPRWVEFSLTAAVLPSTPPDPSDDRVQIILPVPNRSAASLTFGPEIPELYAPLVDLGPVSEMTSSTMDTIFDTVGEVAAGNRYSLTGSLPTEFGTTTTGGTWVRPDVDGLSAVTSRLLSGLIKAGIRGSTVPDAVIDLQTASRPPDAFFDRPPEKVFFDRLGVKVGDQVYDFTFGVLSSGALLSDGSPYRNGDVIALADLGGAPDPDDEEIVYPDAHRASTEINPEGRKFRIPVLVPEGVETGDGRIFAPLSLKTRDLPLPLLWQIKTGEAHNGSVLVGRIDSVERTPQGLGEALGVFDTGPYAREAQRLVEHKFLRGVSADLDKFEAEAEMPEDDVVQIVAVPQENSEGGAKTKGKSKSKKAPEPKRSRKITSTAVKISAARVMGATLVPKPAFQESYIELVDDQPVVEEEPIVADGIYVSAPDVALTACAMVAAAIPVHPPKVWFDRPVLNGETPITVTDEGQVFGHIAAWRTDHIGLPFGTKPPRSRSGYAYFHTGVCRTAEGKDVGVGQLTLAGGHADLELSASAAVKHYDDTASAVADVHAGEDSYGIWVAGALRPGTTPEQVRALRASAPSGDWRPIQGRLELVAVCQVNVPGFPIARARVASGYVTALVAAGAKSIAELRGPSLEQRLASLEKRTQATAEQAQVASAAQRVRERFHAPPAAVTAAAAAVAAPVDPALLELQAAICAVPADVSADVRKKLRQQAKQLGAPGLDLVPSTWLTPAALREEITLTAAGGPDEISIYKNYSKKTRQEMAERGEALESGRYPIKEPDDIRRALRIFAREPADTKPIVQKHIVRRAKELERLDLVPSSWQDVIELSVEELTLDIELSVDDYLTLKNFSPDQRKKLAADKKALPGGSFPIENTADLKRAVQAYGRAADKDKAKVRRHIIRRARGLGHPELIPDSWKAASVNNALAQAHRTSPDEEAILDGIVMGLSSQSVITAALKFRPPFEERQHPRSTDTGKFVSVLARLRKNLEDKTGTSEAVEALDRAQAAVDSADLDTAKDEADSVVKLVDDIADRTVSATNRNDLHEASSDLGGAIAALPVEQGQDASVKYRFTDLPQTLQQLIRDLMERLSEVTTPEKFDELSGPLRVFMAGGDVMGTDEIQANMAKMLGPLVMAAR